MTQNNSATLANTQPFVLPEQDQRGNIWRLSAAQALAGANSVVVYATGAIIGNSLAPTPMLASPESTRRTTTSLATSSI